MEEDISILANLRNGYLKGIATLLIGCNLGFTTSIASTMHQRFDYEGYVTRNRATTYGCLDMACFLIQLQGIGDMLFYRKEEKKYKQLRNL
jgi:hypothetical protein